MKTLALSLAALVLTAACATAQDWAKQRLDKSPRHAEWVKLKHDKREVQAFVVYPEVDKKATAVLVIHEIFGLTDWARSVADELAEAGYVAIAPDLLSGMGPKGGGTAEFGGDDAARKAVAELPADQVTADLNAAAEYVAKLPACNGKVAVAGFCWGGGQAFRVAENNKDVKASFAFYGTGPQTEDEAVKVNCPVYGFYGGDDARVTMTVAKTTEVMKKADKTYDPVTYDKAGHGFMRAGEAPDAKEDNKKAHDEAWKRWKGILAKL
jgi:carboxymethylenebutenolidase